MTNSGQSSDEWLVSENIKHFKKKLLESRDENWRRILQGLIEEERNKLAGLEHVDSRESRR